MTRLKFPIKIWSAPIMDLKPEYYRIEKCRLSPDWHQDIKDSLDPLVNAVKQKKINSEEALGMFRMLFAFSKSDSIISDFKGLVHRYPIKCKEGDDASHVEKQKEEATSFLNDNGITSLDFFQSNRDWYVYIPRQLTSDEHMLFNLAM